MNRPVKIDTKIIHEILPNFPSRKTDCVCRMCNERMQVWGELISISWNDYLDGSGEMIDLCEPCASLVIGKIKEIIGGKN